MSGAAGYTEDRSPAAEVPMSGSFSLFKAVPAGLALMLGAWWAHLGAPPPAFFQGGDPAPAFQLAAVEKGEGFAPTPRKATFLLFWAST